MPGRRKVSGVGLLACLAILPAQVLSAQTASVEGTVLNSVTHSGIPDVRVTLWTNEGTNYHATTDVSGAFQIMGVQPGAYRSRYEKSGFQRLEQPGFGFQQTPLGVGNSGTVRTSPELVPFATLRGRVLDPDEEPAAHVKVELGLAAGETDDEGRFELSELRPGTFTLRVSPKAEPELPQVVGQAIPPGNIQIIPTYYPSTANLADAERIQVRPGADLAGYEIHLRTSAVYRVRGVVLDETGKPAPKVSVRLLGPVERRLLAGRQMAFRTESFLNMRWANEESSVISSDNGTFEFPAVPPGDWSLEAELDPKHDAKNNLYFVTSNRVPAPVSDRDIENVELTLEPDFTVEVAPDWGDQQPPAANQVPLVMLVPEGRPRAAMPGGPRRFEHVQQGLYRIVPTPGMPPGFYPAAVMLGDRDVLGQDVELTAAAPSIRVVYKPNPGSIRGTVEQGEGTIVLLWPQGAAIPDVVRAVEAGPHGAFEIPNVSPGDYSVVAFDRVDGQGGSESFVLGAVAAGARVKISEGSSETVQIPVTRWPD